MVSGELEIHLKMMRVFDDSATLRVDEITIFECVFGLLMVPISDICLPA